MFCLEMYGFVTHSLTTKVGTLYLVAGEHALCISSWWWVTCCFLLIDEKGTLKDASLVRMFLMMQPWYIPSTDMAKKLVLKYP